MRANPQKSLIRTIWHAIIGYQNIVFDSYTQGWMMAEIRKSKFSKTRFYFNADHALKDSAINQKDEIIHAAFFEGFQDSLNSEEKHGANSPLVLKCYWLNSYAHYSSQPVY